jgi:hypothetical protein
MKRIGLGTIFVLLMSLAIFSYAQPPAQDLGAGNQEPPNKHQEVPPPPREPEMKPPSGQEEAKPTKQQPEAKPRKSEKQEKQAPSSEQQKPAHEQHGTSAQQRQTRPAGKSVRIPDPQFKANFGKQHRFAVNRLITTTTVVPNQTQFVYAGYAFIFLDPWPADWVFTDECYIDSVDEEYFLFDVFHPGIRVALFVVG